MYSFIYLSVCLSIGMAVYLSVRISHLPTGLYPSVTAYPSVYLSGWQSICLYISSWLPLCLCVWVCKMNMVVYRCYASDWGLMIGCLSVCLCLSLCVLVCERNNVLYCYKVNWSLMIHGNLLCAWMSVCLAVWLSVCPFVFMYINKVVYTVVMRLIEVWWYMVTLWSHMFTFQSAWLVGAGEPGRGVPPADRASHKPTSWNGAQTPPLHLLPTPVPQTPEEVSSNTITTTTTTATTIIIIRNDEHCWSQTN